MGVGVGEVYLAVGIVVRDGTLVDDVPAEQAPSEKSRNPTRSTRGAESGFKRRGSECESWM